MQKKILSKAKRYIVRKHRRRIWKKVVGSLACLTVFCTVYALILPAVTLEYGEAVLYGYEENDAVNDPDAAEEAEKTIEPKESASEEPEEGTTIEPEESASEEPEEGTAIEPEESASEEPEKSTAIEPEESAGEEPEEGTAIEPEESASEEPEEGTAIEPEESTTMEPADAEAEIFLQENPEGEIMALDLPESYDTVERFYLWLKLLDITGTPIETAVYSSSKWDANQGISDALIYTENSEIWYLIPVSYFAEYYKDYGFAFDKANTDTCPIVYAPDANNSEEKLTAAGYVYVEETANETDDTSGWYVKIQDTGSYGDGEPPRSNLYFTYYGTQPVESFRLWMHAKRSSDSGYTSVASYTETTEETLSGKVLQVLGLENSGTTYYLIPVSYFAESYADYGYAFDVLDTDTCPIVYAPDANSSGENLTAAGYVYVGETANETDETSGWYVKIQDTGSYSAGPPRSNVYYEAQDEADNSFTLTYGTDTITFYVVDSEGNALEGEYEDIAAEGSTKYVFGTASEQTGNEKGTVKEITLPEVEGYTCSDRLLERSLPVASVATAGYVNCDGGIVAAFQFYTAEPMTSKGWYSRTGSNAVYLIYQEIVSVVEDTMSHGGTVVNLFDYSVAADVQEEGSANGNGQPAGLATGINAQSNLQFSSAGSKDKGIANYWTGNGVNPNNGKGGVLQGIVAPVLDDKGYPSLSGNSEIIGGDTSNLDYLFDPEVPVTGTDADGSEICYKASYTNVGGLLQLDGNGYYYYDSTQNYAEFKADENKFDLYSTWAVQYSGAQKGEFFPFDPYSSVSKSTDAGSSLLNHYFGMTLTTRFVQEYGGYTDSTRRHAMIFDFSGDDDVWIFIDDVLVADLGGIHDSASVDVDFAKGTVSISSVYKDLQTLESDVEIPFSDIFQGTNVALTESGTFQNDTYHTLKFFYLERGGNASNLKLKYNLKEVPSSAIVKVDQYGDPVADATFALYAAKKEVKEEDGTFVYQYLLDGTEDTYLSLEGLSYTIDVTDEEGKITVGSGEYEGATITPIYYGVTDTKGNMTFLDDDGMPLALADLQSRANGSSYFILREVVVPEGYRVVSDEVWLYLENNILYCDNVYVSGVWASATALVTATNTLYLNDIAAADGGELASALQGRDYVTLGADGSVSVNYYDPDKGADSVKGTLFAVVLKYHGGKTADSLVKLQSWTPVYGNGISGYTLWDKADITDRNQFIEAVIGTAKTMNGNEAYSNTVFEMGDSRGMQLLLTELPGELSSYYSMLLKHYDGPAEELNDYIAQNVNYMVAYYWTTEDTLEGATIDNTFRVNAEKMSDYAGFVRTFGATIEVPDLVNRLLVQKLAENEDGTTSLVNGAAFAMYSVGQEAGSEKFYYIGENGDGAEVKIYLTADDAGDGSAGTARVENDTGEYTYTINASDGVIDVKHADGTSACTIRPVEIQTTNTSPVAGEEGTAIFGHRSTEHGNTLNSGSYIVREISAPEGYSINPAEVQVLVDDTAVYANAGTEEDGVTVARGPGYVSGTLQKFASYGDVDNTLTWVYERLLVSGQSTRFAEVYNALKEDGSPNWKYLESYTGSGYSAETTVTDSESGAFTTHLMYDDEEGADSLFNYKVNQDWYREKNRSTDSVTRRLYTSVGWSYYLLYQDYEWAQSGHIKEGARYTDLRNHGDISNLFSCSTYIQVTDKKVSNLKISKTVVNAQAAKDAPDRTPFEFRVNLYPDSSQETELSGSYAYTIYDIAFEEDGTEILTEGSSGTIQSGGTICLKDKQSVLIKGLPYSAYYKVTETGSEDYITTVKKDGGTAVSGYEASGALIWENSAEENDTASAVKNTASAAYTNTYLPKLTIAVRKVDSADSTKMLSGAEFVLYCKDEGGTNHYYAGENGWEKLAGDKTEADYVLVTDSDGRIGFADIRKGTYYLKEIKAPDGYKALTGEIPFTIKVAEDGTADVASNGNLFEKAETDPFRFTVTVPNSSGYMLPNTGGSGTKLYTYSGLLLMAGALMYGCMLRRRRERRGRN